MSTEEDKFKHSKRLHQEENAIHKQQAIALQHGIDKKLVEDEPHRFAKHHVMDENIPHKVNKAGKIDSKGWQYNLANLIVAVLLGINLYYKPNISSIIIEAVWFIIAAYGLIRYYRNRDDRQIKY